MNNSERNISYGNLLIIIIFFSVFFLSILGMQMVFPNLDNEKKADFSMELIKIVFSSLLSAAVAYCVSYVQLKNSFRREKENKKQMNEERIKLLILEISDNEEVLKKIEKAGFLESSSDILKTQVSQKILNMYFDQLAIDTSVLAKIMLYDKKISMFIISSSDVMKATYVGLIEEIEILKKILKELIKD